MYLKKEYGTDLREIISLRRPVYAHLDRDGIKDKETLQEHTMRCEKYFFRLLEAERTGEAFETLEEELLRGVPIQYGEWFRRALYGIITFHDTGKINPRFQTEKMHNMEFSDCMIVSMQESTHSILSAYIYLDYFLGKLEELFEKCPVSKKDQAGLFEMLLLNAYLISRHHSGLEDFTKFLNQLCEGGRLYEIQKGVLRGEFETILQGRFSTVKLQVLWRSQACSENSEERQFAKYIYARLVFSLLTASDYYATNEYMYGMEMNNFGNISEIEELNQIYEDTSRVRSIRVFARENGADDGKDINYLRNSMFLEAEKNLFEHKEDDIFFLEAPTGSGKSNVAFNCSFKLAGQGMGKIIYVYPFNNLVEQNKITLEELFAGSDIFSKVAVLNSVTPIKREGMEAKRAAEKEENVEYYQKALLDRQFWNYPIILTTHVNIFQTMFGTEREAVFGFAQLAGSVLVLDEIQSYKNALWAEIMKCLQYFAKYLHCKVLIMSATLPDLTYLTGRQSGVRRLICDRQKYFGDARFKNRVTVSYELLEDDFDVERLYDHVRKQAQRKKKILIEFIKKDMAYGFYDLLMGDDSFTVPVERMTGDDNAVDRENILKHLKDPEYCRDGCVLVATQVVEAGVDIDMDIGYKDISFLDSEEQFLGRINRNYKREGIVYFFNICEADQIYKGDFRMNRQFTLANEEMRNVLKTKNFDTYYKQVLEIMKKNRNESTGKDGLDYFVREELQPMKFKAVEERMKLISENEWQISVFLARKILDFEGEELDGEQVWEEYKELLTAPPSDYARFRVELSDLRSKLNLFVYKISKTSDLAYHDRLGELYYIANGEQYFENGKFNRNKLKEQGGLFLDI